MPSERTVDIGGLEVSLLEAGVGGVPMLLVHGFTGNKSDFEPVIEVLAGRGLHVVAPDIRGHGNSQKPESEAEYSFDIFAQDALALTDALGWDEFVLLGHSMGGMVAQEMVICAPSRVRGLILMDTSYTKVAFDPELVRAGVAIIREKGLAALVSILRDLDDPLGTPAHTRTCESVDGYAERGEHNTLMCSPAMYAAMLVAMTETEGRLDRLATVSCPTLIIVGEQDEPFTEPSVRMSETIPGAELRIVKDAGHSPQFESPDEWFAAVLPFLDAIKGQPEGSDQIPGTLRHSESKTLT